MKIVTITPEMAEKMLSKNTSNRKQSKVTVTKYAKDITLGNWILNGESIKFTKDGSLIDGQHRLMAIVKAGVPVQSYIIDNLDSSQKEQIFSTVDQGKVRSIGDVFSCEKIRNAQAIGVCTKLLLYFYKVKNITTNGVANLSRTMSKYDILEYGKAHMEKLQFWNDTISKDQKQSKVLPLPICVGMAIYLEENGAEQHIVKDFFSKLFLGYGGLKESPNQLRAFIIKNDLNKMLRPEDTLRFYLSAAWNAFVKGGQFYPNTNKIDNAEQFPSIIFKED
jgi:hypothetical protein